MYLRYLQRLQYLSLSRGVGRDKLLGMLFVLYRAIRLQTLRSRPAEAARRTGGPVDWTRDLDFMRLHALCQMSPLSTVHGHLPTSVR